ncbi:carboxypeptidase-like regulatory domain-containing protein [uncultured Lamprocystis sp.]|jgi:hypothetical protein|uniref:carboxypeptidase-like regulatory domain-containing protein n=1 Tax=uncultured Lamprocystis sp. TaxID=543132 RepID=UPI0025DE13FF|nr:carboxypeptidase-like regulatory domain-containing protein [uncultured Lamprocystis sp.]
MGIIRGRVIDAAGRPVEGVAVFVVQAPASLPDIALLSGADGTFILNAVTALGTYRLGARAADLQGETEFSIGADDATVDVEIAIGAGRT